MEHRNWFNKKIEDVEKELNTNQKEGEFLSKYWIYFLPAIGGSFIGAFLLKKIKAEKLRFLFAIIIFYSAVRLLFN